MSIARLEAELLEARAKYHDMMHASLQEREVAREAFFNAQRAKRHWHASGKFSGKQTLPCLM